MAWEDNFESRGTWANFKTILETDSSWRMRRHALLFKDETKWDTDAEWNAGTHSGTSASSNKLVAGGAGGTWTSPVVENAYSAKTPVFRDLFWKEVVGNVTSVEVRGSNISAAQVLSNTWRAITEDDTNRNFLNWFEWKWIQFRLTLPANAEVSEFRFHDQWNISDYVEGFGSLVYERDLEASKTEAGDVRLTIGDYDDEFAVYQDDTSYTDKTVEVWIGLEDGADVYLFPFYVGYLDDMVFDVPAKRVEFDSRNVFGRYSEIVLGQQTDTEPYRDGIVFYGTQNYAPVRQDEDDKTIFYLDSKYDLTSISKVYVNRVEQTSGYSQNTTAPGTITFDSQPDGKVEVDFVGHVMPNAMDIIEDLFETEAGEDADFLFDRTAWTLARTRAEAYSLNNVRVKRKKLIDQVEEILRHVNGVMYPDYLTQSRIAFHIFYPDYASTLPRIAVEDSAYADAICSELTLRHSREEWANRVDVKYKAGIESYTYVDQDAIDDVGESAQGYELPYLSAEAEVRQSVAHRFYLFRKPLSLHAFGDVLPLALTYNVRDRLDFYDPTGYRRTVEIYGVVKDFSDCSVRALECSLDYASILNWAFAVDTVGDPLLWYAIDTALPSDPNWNLRSYAF